MARRNDKVIRGIRSSMRTRTLLGRLSPGEGNVEMLGIDEVISDFLNGPGGGGSGPGGSDALTDLINDLIDARQRGAMLPLVNGDLLPAILSDDPGGSATAYIPGFITTSDGQCIGVAV